MADPLFIDTWGWLALEDSKDLDHARAAQLYRAFRKENGRAVTTDYVLDEAITLLKMRGHGHLIEEFTRIALKSHACRVEWMDPKRFDAVHGFFVQHGDHDYSFKDCFSFYVMRQSKLREALTKDEHFKEAGYQPLLI